MDRERSQRFMQKVVGDAGTAMAAALVFIGDRVGLFRAMAGAGALRAQDLVESTGIHPRYVEEWLGAMVCAGYVEYDADSERFTLPDEHAAFLTDPASEYYLGGLFSGLPGLMAMAPRLAAAFERGGGVSFADFGEGGSYLMVEPRVEDSLEHNRENPFARMLFSISCLHCVPQSLAQGGPGLGACWGPARARELARQAGFTHFEPLAIRSPVMSFYELRA